MPLRSRFFNNDAKIGKIGENCLRCKLSRQKTDGKIQYYIDNTMDRKSQKDDIDFTILKNDGNTITYECKTDCYAINTRNISYELTSHDFAGCLGRSNSDYIYYVFVNESKMPTEEYLISLQEWRRWIGENSQDIKPYEKGPRNKLQLFYSKDIGVLQFLCNIDCMVNDGIAKKM